MRGSMESTQVLLVVHFAVFVYRYIALADSDDKSMNNPVKISGTNISNISIAKYNNLHNIPEAEIYRRAEVSGCGAHLLLSSTRWRACMNAVLYPSTTIHYWTEKMC